MSWNPNSPRALGGAGEWIPSSMGQTPLNADAVAVAFKINSNATETIDALRLGAYWDNSAYRFRQQFAVDIYNLGQLGLTDAVTIARYVPNGTVLPTQAFSDSQPWYGIAGQTTYTTAGDMAYLHGLIGDDSATSYIVRIGGSATSAVVSAAFNFNSVGYAGTNRPLAVYFDYTGYVQVGQTSPDMSESYLYLYRNGSFVGYLANQVPLQRWAAGTAPSSWPSQTIGPIYINPETLRPWTVTDIRDFDGTYSIAVGVAIPNGGTGLPSRVYISEAALRVQSIPERRVAWAVGTYNQLDIDMTIVPPETLRSDVGVYLQHTDTAGDNWAKLDGTDYLVVVRKLRPEGWPTQNASLRYIESVLPNPHQQGQGVDVTIDPSGRLLTVGSENTKSYAMWPENTSDVVSVDAQPYHDMEWLAIHATAGYTAEQTITPTDNRTYAVIRALVGYTPGLHPNAALQARIVRVSDDVVMGDAGEIELADFALLPNQRTWITPTYPQIRATDAVFVLATAATLVSGTAYRIEFLSDTDTGYWLVANVRADQPDNTTGDRSAPGSGTVITGTADLVAVALDRPAAPGTIDATLVNTPATDPGDTLCDVGTIPSVTVEWSATALGSTFDRYEVERYDDDVTGWQLIANVRTEATVAFTDYEMMRSVQVWYRVRVVRNDGGVSAWATSSPVTPTQGSGTAQIASNSAQSALGFVKLDPDDEWGFRSSGQAVLRPMFERDYELALRPTELLGDRWSLPVLIWSGRIGEPSPGPGRRAFEPLKAMVDNPLLPYLAVLSPDGDRWYANLVMPNGTRQSVPRTYVAFLYVTEVASTATPIEVP